MSVPVRAIPVLLVDGRRLVKSRRFQRPVYLGDPRNAVKIFSDRGADELLVLDVTATVDGRGPDVELIEEIVAEAFMPVAYGGGIRDLATAKAVVAAGVEKVVVNSAAFEQPGLVRALANEFGSSSVVVCLDVRKRVLRGERVHVRRGTRPVEGTAEQCARRVVAEGAGEVIVQSVDRDGEMTGYDIPLVERVAGAVGVPIIACGGAGSLDDLAAAARAGASGVAAGSLFVFRGPHRAVMINYPDQAELDRVLDRRWELQSA